MRARRAPRTSGKVRRPSVRSPAWSSMSFTISRTKWIQAARIQGTIPAAACPTAMAPYMSGRPATSATATFPTTPRRLSTGEYRASTAKAARPTSTAVPLTSAAAPSPTTAPPATHRSAVPRATRPAASGRSAPGRFTRSAAWSQMSLSTLPAIPNPTAATAASARTLGVWSARSAIQPPARTPAAATSRLWTRTSRGRSVTQHVLVHLLVARHDAVGRELERPAGGGIAHPRLKRTVAQQAEAVGDHGLDVPLREAAHGSREDRHAARHRFERRKTERLGLGRQQEQIAASQDLGDVVHLAEEADVAL